MPIWSKRYDLQNFCILRLLFGPVLALGNTGLGACQMSELEEFDKAFFVNTREKVERFGH